MLTMTKEQAMRFLLAHHHLTDDTALTGKNDILAFVKKVGCIQFDPLDVVGRNADLVLQSRLKNYKKSMLEELLYRNRTLIDVWDKNMAIALMEDWPYFARNRAHTRTWYDERVFAGVGVVREHLKKNEYACTADIGLDDKIGWFWGEERLAKAALECMGYAGEAVVHHKRGTRRYYALAENCVPKRLIDMEDPNATDEAYDGWLVLRRINSIGLLWNRGGDAWLGLLNFKSANRNKGFKKLMEEGAVVEVRVEGISHPLYTARENVPLAQEMAKAPPLEGNGRILAPLDNMLWDRKLIYELTGFDYKWEVYVPASKRQYGYYVLPVMANGRFAGRIEMAVDKEEKALVVKRFWWEEDIRKKSAYRRHVKAAVKRFSRFCDCKSVNFLEEI
ncbi:winged helix DNA-binding domain-containing protein [Christensenellaceae bacterium OttesenSCG-928-M15]|nr:winged helix DNA-binding domain-containing protein [Christensenellaceae bacterium OttesenSCG-928-M15]